jgi:hypothetical protein
VWDVWAADPGPRRSPICASASVSSSRRSSHSHTASRRAPSARDCARDAASSRLSRRCGGPCAVEAALEVEDGLAGGAGVIGRLAERGWRPSERAAQCFGEEADLGIPLGEAIAQLALLGLQLRRQSAVLFLEVAQPAYIGAVGGADHAGQHVHVAEGLAHESVGRQPMALHSPVGAAPDRVVPQPAQRLRVLRLGEMPDRYAVAMVERLLDELPAALRLAGQGSALFVQVMVVGGVGAGSAQFDQEPTDFSARRASTDDGAMHAVMHVPDRSAFPGCGRHQSACG